MAPYSFTAISIMPVDLLTTQNWIRGCNNYLKQCLSWAREISGPKISNLNRPLLEIRKRNE